MSKSDRQACIDYLQLIVHHPEDYKNWLKLGWVEQDPNISLEFFQEALVLAPGNPMVLASIAWAEDMIKDPTKEDNLGDTAEDLKDLQVLRPRKEAEIAVLPSRTPFIYWRVLASRKLLIWWLGLYLSLIALAETLTTLFPTIEIGIVLHGLVLLVLIFHSAIVVSKREQRLLLTLAFAPLIRMTSLSIPLRDIPQMYWYMAIGVPLFLAAFLMVRYVGFGWQEIGLTGKRWRLQVLLGVVGLALGYLEYQILRPMPLAGAFSLPSLIGPAIILLVFTGFLEEFIFRGLMQRAFTSMIGKYEGILYVSFIFAILHLGYRSVLDVLFVFWVAVLFSLITLYTGSILGATLAHGLTNIALFLVFPFLLSPVSTPSLTAVTPTIIPLVTETMLLTPTPFQPMQPQDTPFTTPSLVEILPIPPEISPTMTPTLTVSEPIRLTKT